VAEIPGHKKRFYERKWIAEAVSAIPPIGGALYAVYAASKNDALKPAVPWLLASAGWLAFGLIWKIGLARREEEKQSAKTPLYAALCVLQVTVARELGVDPAELDALRVTFHRVVKPNRDPTKIEQLTPYVGGAGGEPGREFAIQAGVAGRAATTGKPRILQFASASSINERVDALTEWGYTKEGAQTVVGKNRLSFMGVPIFGTSGHVIGIVYLDSVKENLFTGQNLDIVMNTCAGIALYLEQYS
jgi:hypothetical protein